MVKIILQQKNTMHHQIESYIDGTLPGYPASTCSCAFRLATLALHSQLSKQYFHISALHFSFLFRNQDIFVASSGSLVGSFEGCSA